MLSAHYKTLPIFWGHGTADTVIHYDMGTTSRDWLHSVGVQDALAGAPGLSFNAYHELQHSASPQELNDLKAFLVKVLPGDQ
jgi:predicted esterase